MQPLYPGSTSNSPCGELSTVNSTPVKYPHPSIVVTDIENTVVKGQSGGNEAVPTELQTPHLVTVAEPQRRGGGVADEDAPTVEHGGLRP